MEQLAAEIFGGKIMEDILEELDIQKKYGEIIWVLEQQEKVRMLEKGYSLMKKH